MIWHSILNILAALIRNVIQGKHLCIRLEHDEQWGWEWDCSCGEGRCLYPSEVKAIESFGRHIDRQKVSA